KLPDPSAPSSWLVYFLAEDLAGTTERATSLGGELIAPITAIPDMGSFAMIKDPTGAVFGLFSSS
ncbi:MAG: VOC family protein, partial [Pseudomonadota bacterium]